MQDNSYSATSTHSHSDSTEENKQSNLNGMGLLSLINEVKSSIESCHSKKIEELEYKLLEKEEVINALELEISTIKAQNEEKDLELYKLREEINAGKRILEQLLHKLDNQQ